MKHRIVAMILVLILCAVALLIGPHLVFHEEPLHHETACPVCELLRRNEDAFICLLAAMMGGGLLCAAGTCFRWTALENRLVPEWTPVRLKVKLLN